jgi:multidrug efflux pump subunit AcrA (membrane-fusion protein)
MLGNKIMANLRSSISLTIVGLFLLALCACNKPKEETAVVSNKPIVVKVETIEPSMVSDKATLVGRLDSRNAVSLYPKIDGTISSILVRPGEHVKQGQLLISIDAIKQEAAVAEKESNIASAKADHQKEIARLESLRAQRSAQEASVEYDKHEFERNYWLEQRGVVAEATVDSCDRMYKVSLAKLKETDENIAAQKEVIQRAARAVDSAVYAKKEQEEQLAFYHIKAPFAGVLADIPVKIGDYVNSATKLTAVSTVRPLEVKVLVPKELAAGLRIGMPLELLDGEQKVISTCSVFHIDPIVDEDNQSVLVKALFGNDSEQYRPEQSISTRLVLKQDKGISIPTAALSFVAGRAFAYVVSSDPTKAQIAKQRVLTISSLNGNRAVITNGVNAGDKVVVAGIQNLREGSPIAIE